MSNEQDNKPERTALQQSIQRKKDLIKHLSDNQISMRRHTPMYKHIEIEKGFLREQITEDEKLLSADRSQWEDAYLTGWNDSVTAFHEGFEVPTEKQRFDEKYATDGK